MNLTRRSLFAMLFVAPLAKLLPKSRPFDFVFSHARPAGKRLQDANPIKWTMTPKRGEFAYAYFTPREERLIRINGGVTETAHLPARGLTAGNVARALSADQLSLW